MEPFYGSYLTRPVDYNDWFRPGTEISVPVPKCATRINHSY